MIIDAHQHFWKYDPIRDAWIDDSMGRLKQNFLPDDLQPILEKAGIDGTIAVQADQTLEETAFLLDLADQFSIVKGVVGWVDLLAGDLSMQLSELSRNPKLKGFRHILQAEKDEFFKDIRLINGISELKNHGFSYDILIYEKQLPLALDLVQGLPVMTLVIDHIAKPDIRSGSFERWSDYMELLSEFDHVNVKLSGMITEADWNDWKSEDLVPYLDHCLECFGAERLMFGSDWPVCLLAGEYNEVAQIIKNYVSSLSIHEQEMIMGKTAEQFYRL